MMMDILLILLFWFFVLRWLVLLVLRNPESALAWLGRARSLFVK